MFTPIFSISGFTGIFNFSGPHHLGKGRFRQTDFSHPNVQGTPHLNWIFVLFNNGLHVIVRTVIDLGKAAVLLLAKAGAIREHQVKNSSLQKPSKVDRACARLDSAVARLEEALAKQGDIQAPSGAGPDPLTVRELDLLRDENAKLKTINDTVSGRLDNAIGRLRTVIGEP